MLKFHYYFSILFLVFSVVKCEDLEIPVDEIENDNENYEEAFDLDPIVPAGSSNQNGEYVPDYRGSQLWRMAYYPRVFRPLQLEAYAQIWNSDKRSVDVLIHAAGVERAKQILASANLSYTVSIGDLEKAIEDENPPKQYIQELVNRDGTPITWKAYHRVNDIYKYLDFIARENPDIVRTEVIGYSAERRPLRVVRISNGRPNNQAIWIDAGIHAREWISPAAVTYIIQQFIEEWEDQPDYIRNIDWYFLPVTNPDGYEYSHTTDRLWRKNRAPTGYGQCKGVDLNRNYAYKWGGKGVSKNPCTEIYGGSGPFSEPETAAIRDFIQKRPAKFNGSVSFHSYGQYILYPWGYERLLPPDHQELARVANAAAAKMANVSGNRYTVGPAAVSLYPAAGGSDDWAKGSVGMKYSYTVELRDTGRYGFIIPASQIIGSGQEALKFVETLAEAVYQLN